MKKKLKKKEKQAEIEQQTAGLGFILVYSIGMRVRMGIKSQI